MLLKPVTGLSTFNYVSVQRLSIFFPRFFCMLYHLYQCYNTRISEVTFECIPWRITIGPLSSRCAVCFLVKVTLRCISRPVRTCLLPWNSLSPFSSVYWRHLHFVTVLGHLGKCIVIAKPAFSAFFWSIL